MSNTTVLIGVDKIFPNPDNPRKDLGDLAELTESIRKNGIMQNLSVVRKEDGKDEYIVLIGHRRLAAAKAAGLTEVPCKVVDNMSLNQQIGVMLEENMQRTDLTAIEQAGGFQMMLDLGETVSSIADKTGFSQGTIRHRVELSKLDKDLLKTRETDSEDLFQLNLTDLYKLEKVDDVEDRNKILATARNSAELENSVSRYLYNKACNTNRPKIVEELEKLGVKPETEEIKKNRYSSRYESPVRISLSDTETLREDQVDKINELLSDHPKGVWYTTYYNYEVGIITKKKVVREQHEETEYDRQKKRARKLDEIQKKLVEERRLVISDIVKGERKPLSAKDQQKVIDYCWPKIRQVYGFFGDGFEAATGKRYYSAKEEFEAYGEKPMWMQMLASCEAVMDLLSCHNYDSSFRHESAKMLKEYHDLLNRYYGFKVEDEELVKYLDGTHELYKENVKKSAEEKSVEADETNDSESSVA